MIFHDINKTELDFGRGDIIISSFAANDNSYAGVSFRQANECHKIGEELKDYDKNLNTDNEDVIMAFSSIESIDVVIYHLQQARDYMLKNMQQGDTMSIDEKSIVEILREDKHLIANLVETIGLDNVLDSLAYAIEKEYCNKG